MRRGGWLALLLCGGVVQAQPAALPEAPADPLTATADPVTWPTIVDIAFEGNDTTQPRTMQRELVIQVGDPADPARIERSRQAVLNLGLFKQVDVREERIASGVRVVFVVRERYFILPTPRFDAKSDGRYAYGAQLRWNNLWGLNHTLRLFWEQEEQQREGIGKDTQWSAGYYAPFVADTPYNVGLAADYTTRPVIGQAGAYDEEFRSSVATVSRTFSDGPASQGWTVGGGLRWQEQRTQGVFARPAYGEATAPLVYVNFRDFHQRIYSEVGTVYGAGYEYADDGWGDYGYANLSLGGLRYLQLGSTEHQTLHLIANTGLQFGGPGEVERYSLGGASRLRGYDLDFIEGNAYWYTAVELARPVRWRWLRAVLMIEAGNVAATPEDMNGRVYGSVGAGLRLRFSNFINFEVEAGIALPLNGDGGARFFAGGV